MLPNLPPPTIRSEIIAHLMARFAACVEGEGGRYITWNNVSDCPLTANEKTHSPAVGIFDGPERKSPEVGRSRCTLALSTEFHFKLGKGDNPSEVGRRVMGEVQTVMCSDIYCGGLTLNIVEVGNELDVEGPNDTSVSGIIFWEILYRHSAGNPRQM